MFLTLGLLYSTRDRVSGYTLAVELKNPYAREHTAIAVFALAGGAWHKVGYVPARTDENSSFPLFDLRQVLHTNRSSLRRRGC